MSRKPVGVSYASAIETSSATLTGSAREPTDGRSIGARDGRFASLEALAEHLWMLVPGLLVIYLGFDAGGFFAGTTGAAAGALALLLAVRVVTTRNPLSGLTLPGLLALAGLAALTALSLLSEAWSHAPARALLSFDLAALYLVLTALCSTVGQPANRLRTMIYGLLVALTAVCGAGLLSRTLPRVFPVAGGFLSQRLSYPVSYWNALGMLAALGIVLAVHVSSDREAHPAARILATGVVPALGATLILTFSRGAIGTLAVALVLYVLLAPRVSLLMTAIAVAPISAIALRVTYDANLLGSTTPTSAAAVGQGHHVALVVALCVAGACALRAILLIVERRLPAIDLPRWAWLVPAAVVVVAAIVLAPRANSWIHRQYHEFVNSSVSAGTAPARARLTSVSNNGRLQLWRVALHGFDAQPLRGGGAGTYALLWERNRPSLETVQDAHSLYLQTLAELGVTGTAALALFWLGLLVGAGRRIRAIAERPLAALAVACLVAWALHSAVDWDWQMPVVMVPVLALAAAVTASTGARWRAVNSRSGARPAGAGSGSPEARAGSGARGAVLVVGRGLVGLCCLALGVAPTLVAVSQADLDASVRAFERHDCTTATARAQAAHSVVGWRPEPLEVIGYCQARHGAARAAERTMRQAITRDPGDWEFHYGLAIATAAAGSDPRPALRVAQRLDPREPLLAAAASAFRGQGRARWRHAARTLPLDVP